MLVVDVAALAARRAAVASALAAGFDTIQLRDRTAGGGALLDAARSLVRLARTHGARVLVNDRLDVAVASGAAGVHLPAASFPAAVARAVLGVDAWIGRSTHSPGEAHAAAASGADYVALGPVFATPSKAAFGEPLGVGALEAARRAGIPIVAIGGVTAERVREVVAAGATGVAVVRAILDAADPAAAAGAIVAAVAAAGIGR